MRSYPKDSEDLEKLKAEPWMLELLKYNPAYPHWGPYEDYMSKGGEAWDSRILYTSWKAFGPWGLDDYNECVNFYFDVERESKSCGACEGGGLNPATQAINHDFYYGPAWRESITEDEVAALVEAKRIGWDFDREKKEWVLAGPTPTAEVINEINYGGEHRVGARCPKGVVSHDGINRHILVKTRATRLGVYGLCRDCEGQGYVYTKPQANVNLVLWMLVPRKGCSRGVEVKNIKEEELPEIFAWLREAAKRNAARFKKIPKTEWKVVSIKQLKKTPTP